MSQRRIYEIQYSDFSTMLRKAAINHNKIEKPTNKEAWVKYVKKHNVPEPVIWSRGKTGTMSGNVDAVIIEGAGEIDGYYVYCADEAFCLKFESGLE